jgi:hypothetical protein
MRAAICILAIFLLGCSGDLSRSRAAELIHDSFTYHEDPHIDISVGKIGSCDKYTGPHDPSLDGAYMMLAKAGYLTIKPAEKNYWWISLTDVGNKFVSSEGRWGSGYVKEHGCDSTGATFPVAKMKNDPPHITGIVTEGDKAMVTYICRFELTSLGKQLSAESHLLDGFTVQQKIDLQHEIKAANYIHLPLSEDDCGGTYTFQKYDDGWRIK